MQNTVECPHLVKSVGSDIHVSKVYVKVAPDEPSRERFNKKISSFEYFLYLQYSTVFENI